MTSQYILGIETSCDETAIALLECSDEAPARILAEEISSQHDVHRLYGGVVPELASREHLKALPVLFDRVMQDSGIAIEDLSLVAVTLGPGLKGCLLMGVNFAKGLVFDSDIPLIGVNHIEGHVVAPLLDNPQLSFPFLALVVSGGHTEIHQVHGIGAYRLVARTSDDAAGEAFDKSAHLLCFEYPGGAKLAALADRAPGKHRFSLPKVMRESEGLSFSGLKTAIALLVKREADQIKSDEERKADLCAAIQESIVDALCYKLGKAIKKTGIKRVCVTGGVSANASLRKRVADIAEEVYFPATLHCMDNAAMIAYLGFHKYRMREMTTELDIFPRWPIETALSVQV